MSSIAVIYNFLFLSVFFSGFVVCLKSVIATSIALTMLSASCAFLYFFLNAPDVAMTEVAIGTFLSTAFYLMTIRSTKTESFKKPHPIKYGVAFVCFVLIFISIYSTFTLIGDFAFIKMLENTSGAIYLQDSYALYQIPNVVTAILASFRALDTMGETIIILTAGLGVYIILSHKEAPHL